MEQEMKLMSRDEMIAEADNNRGNQYTTELMWDDGHEYVYVDRNGYLKYDIGEEVLEYDELEEDGWFECTDYNEDGEDDMSYSSNSAYDNPLYDDNDEW